MDHIPDAFFGHNFLRLHYRVSADDDNHEPSPEDAALDASCTRCSWGVEFTPLAVANGMLLE